MSQHACVVTGDQERADQYKRALGDIGFRHITRWCPDRIDGIDVVLFDPETVDRSTVVASRSMNDREHWIVAMGPDVRTTVERVEQAVAGRRFEAAIDARFDALTGNKNEIPSVVVPERFDTTTVRELYAGI